MPHFIRNLNRFRFITLQLFASLIYTIFAPFILVVAISTLIDTDYGFNLETTFITVFFTVVISLYLWVLVILLKSATWMLLDISRDIQPKLLTVLSKKTKRSGRSGPVHYVTFVEYKGAYNVKTSPYSFKKIKKGEPFQCYLLEKSKLVIPV